MIRGIDGLRGYSIILVLITHLGLLSNFKNHKFVLFFGGTTGVSIFFSISGFLITYLLLKEKEKNSRINIKKFFIRRLLRLFPVLILFFLVIIILMLMGKLDINNYSLLLSILYLNNYCPWIFYSPELAHTWSLAVEEQFYLIMPFVLGFMNRKKMIILGMSSLIICIGAPFIYQKLIYHSSNGNIYEFSKMFPYNGSRFFFPACAPIILGCFTAFFGFKSNNFLNKYSLHLLFLIVFIVLISPNEYLTSIPENLIIGLIACLMLIFIFYNQNNLFVKILELAPLKFIGKISYGIYVWQGLFLTTGPIGKLFVQHFPINIILTLIIATISYYYYELRFLKFKNKFV